MELISLAERLAEELGCGLRWGSGTYASRVQQVSPSTSPPGALSVLTDSFSLAGMLTGRGAGVDRGREGGMEKKETDELAGEDSCISGHALRQVQQVLEKLH